MRPIALAMLAALAIGCSTSPTAPSTTSTDVSLLATQDVKPDHTAGTQKVVIYFYGMDFGRNVLVNLPVDVWSTSLTERTVYTTKQHSISVDVPKIDSWLAYRIDADHWPDVCPAEGVLNLPYDVGANWVMLSKCVAQ